MSKKYSGKNLDVSRNALPYAESTLGPVITIPDVTGFKKDRGGEAKKHFTEKAKELQQKYDELVDEIYVNNLLFNVEYNFVPVVGKVYYLYHKDYDNHDSYFLSMIAPWEWDFPFVGAFKFQTNNVWERVEICQN